MLQHVHAAKPTTIPVRYTSEPSEYCGLEQRGGATAAAASRACSRYKSTNTDTSALAHGSRSKAASEEAVQVEAVQVDAVQVEEEQVPLPACRLYRARASVQATVC